MSRKRLKTPGFLNDRKTRERAILSSTVTLLFLLPSAASYFIFTSIPVAQLQQVTEERNRLREAVEQQQRYMLALHAHYQQWADGATAKIKQAQAVLTHQPKTCESIYCKCFSFY